MTGARPADRDPEAGVTLIEMLIAVALCALIGVAGFSMLDTILRANGRAEAALDRVAALDRAFSVLRRDLLETDAAALRLDDGGLVLPAPRPLGYRATGGNFVRTVGDPPFEQVLLDGVASVEFRALGAARDWRPDWPEEGRAAPPAAIELTIETATGDTATRLFHALSGRAVP